MLQDIKQQGTVMRRKVQVSDVRRRPDVILTKKDKAECDMVASVPDEIEETFNIVKQNPPRAHRKMLKHTESELGLKKIALALLVTIVIVVGIVHVVNISTPDVSLRMAAMRDDINAVYPKYTPRGYSLSDITSENGKVTLNFKNIESGAKYSLIEENMDNAMMLSEYVDSAFGGEYMKLDEYGVAVYIGDNGAAWTSGGILFKLKITSGSLTRKQIMSIATTK